MALGVKRHVPEWLLAAMMLTYVGVFGTLTWSQQSNFGTFGFDMGIYDQGIWLLSQFKVPFDTVRGLNYFGHHVNLVTVAFVPAYWLGAGPHFLYVVETVWEALGALAVWLLARDLLGSRWLALGLGAAYLLFPSIEWINWWQFHPDALMITPLLFAYWFGSQQRWRGFWVSLLVALSCKEDAALAAFMIGVIVAVRWNRRMGILAAATSALWFIVATQLILKTLDRGEGPFYQYLFPGFGTTLPQIAFNMVAHPSRWWHLALRPGRVAFTLQLLAPVAFLPVLALPIAAIGGPQFVVDIAAGLRYTHDIHYYYAAAVDVGIFAATVEAIALLGRWRWLRRGLVGLVVVTSLATNVAYSPSPLSRQFHSGIWVAPSPRDAALNHAIALVPPTAGVSATYALVPHLTHRVHIFEFPNPWVATNWGVFGRHTLPPGDVSWLVLDTRNPNFDVALYDRLVGPGGGFRVVSAQQGVVVARRVARSS